MSIKVCIYLSIVDSDLTELFLSQATVRSSPPYSFLFTHSHLETKEQIPFYSRVPRNASIVGEIQQLHPLTAAARDISSGEILLSNGTVSFCRESSAISLSPVVIDNHRRRPYHLCDGVSLRVSLPPSNIMILLSGLTIERRKESLSLWSPMVPTSDLSTWMCSILKNQLLDSLTVSSAQTMVSANVVP